MNLVNDEHIAIVHKHLRNIFGRVQKDEVGVLSDLNDLLLVVVKSEVLRDDL
jgi:hypothetical protein